MASPADAPTDAADGVDASPEALRHALREAGYVADPTTSTVAFLALRLDKPLLVEGPAGVGKTALAVALAATLGRPLIRLQCYDGLDEARTLYEWSYGKQLLSAQLLRESLGSDADTPEGAAEALARFERDGVVDAFFSERFLLPRPLLQAIRSPRPALLLVDEVDRAGEDFEALLLEVLSDHQVTIPELGTLAAVTIPVVVLTSNATRDLSDALKRRCLHVALDYPTLDREREIVRAALPDIDEALNAAVVAAVQRIRALDLRKRPSVGETIDWARALRALGVTRLEGDVVAMTAGVLVKYAADQETVRRAFRA